MKYLFLIATLVAATALFAQSSEKRNITPGELNLCMKNGIKIDTYDWKNEQINYHLNLGLDANKMGNTLSAVGLLGAVVGGIIAYAGADDVVYGDSGQLIAGAGVMAAGSLVWSIGIAQKRKAGYNLDKAVNLLGNY